MLVDRLKNVQKSLEANKIDGLIISSAVNIYYLTGYSNFSPIEREAYLFVTKRTTTLFTDGRYIEAVEKVLPKNVRATVKRLIPTINQIVKHSKLERIGVEKNLSVGEFQKLRKDIDAKFVVTESLLEEMRSIKDGDEVKKLRQAADLTDETYTYILDHLRPEVSEREISYKMESFIKNHGGELAFDTIVAFGPNSSVPHHLTSDKKLTKDDEFILLDFGARVDGYCADVTRTLLTKKSSGRAREVYATVLGAQAASVNYIRSNLNKKMSGKKAFEVANNYIAKNGFTSLPHGLGHGIGLEVHETPRLSKRLEYDLKEGMYFSIEPGIYIPGFGGVRIEDDYLLTHTGLEQLTNSSKEVVEI